MNKKTLGRCMLSKDNKCQSDYNKFHNCDGVHIPNDCPYNKKRLKENE